jgi:hypothetical protein
VPNKNLILYFPLSLVEIVTPKFWKRSVSFFQFVAFPLRKAYICFSYSTRDGILAKLPFSVGAPFALTRSEPKARVTAYSGFVVDFSAFVIAYKSACII